MRAARVASARPGALRSAGVPAPAHAPAVRALARRSRGARWMRRILWSSARYRRSRSRSAVVGAVVAAVARADRARHRDAVAQGRDRGEFRRQAHRHRWRHADRARRERPHLAAPARHRGARRRRHRRRERAESRSRHFPASACCAARCARRASIWSAPNCRCASKPTAASPFLPAPTSGRSRRAPPARAARRRSQAAAEPRCRQARCAAASTISPACSPGSTALGATGLDGHDLRELGLKNGNLTVDDQRNGKRWTFDRINVSLTRPAQGGVIFRLESDNPRAAVGAQRRDAAAGRRRARGRHRGAPGRRCATSCWRCGSTNGAFEADLPLSASIRAEIAADGTPQRVQGQLLAGAGTISDRDDRKRAVAASTTPTSASTGIASATAWLVPFQVQAGGNQFTLRAMRRGAERRQRRLAARRRRAAIR